MSQADLRHQLGGVWEQPRRRSRHGRRRTGYGSGHDRRALPESSARGPGQGDKAWDGTAAEKRVRKWASAKEEPNTSYRDAHVWYDGSAPDNFGSYKLLIADVVNGRLTAMPRGVMAAGAVMQGSRGGVDLPDDEAPRVRGHLARYYDKMGDDPPWGG